MFGNQGWANNRLCISPISPQTSPQKLSFHSEEEEKLKPLPAGFVCDAGVLTTMTEEPGKRGEDYYIHRIYLTGGYSYTTTVDSKFVDDDGDDSCAGRNIGGSRTFEERRDYMNDVVFSPTSGSCPSSKAQYYELKNVGSCGCPDEEADNYDADADWANPIQCEYFALEGLGKLLNTIKGVQQVHNKNLEIEGILLTMFDSRLRLSKQVKEDVKKHFGSMVFQSIIPRNVSLGEAPSYGESIIEYNATSKGSKSYIKFAQEIINLN
jgi:hypothetical protein